MNFTLVESKKDLGFLNKELLHRPYIGVDTEFRRTSKNNMKLAVLQVNDSEEIYLIDCVKIQNPEECSSFLFSKNVKKILHSCKEDLEAIFSWTESKLMNYFDTQLANAFLGGTYSISYQDLVKQEIGIMLEKKETRTNWLRRPLTEAQLDYAASDVSYLIDLYRFQHTELSKLNKLDWLEEELNSLTLLEHLGDSRISRRFNISKEQQYEILKSFNNVVVDTSASIKINPTLLFSKQSQKIFLLNSLTLGVEKSFKGVTKWRKSLIKQPFLKILNNFSIS